MLTAILKLSVRPARPAQGRWVCALGTLTAAAGPAAAQYTPDVAFGWSTVGDPGNRGLNSTEAPFLYQRTDTGRVDYTFQMTTTEVTSVQYLEFVKAFRPFQEQIGSLNDVSYTGLWIGYSASTDSFSVSPSRANVPIPVSWHYAARMVNWLHNGRVNEQWAFETGVYDVSTFGRDPDTLKLTDQAEPSPGAKYWIPSLDEWTKAMYWDPAKNGGEGGYWQYPTSSDDQPVPGLPGVGETNGGTRVIVDVGSYPDVTSPWGLLDGSGGENEWTGSLNFSGTGRFQKGSSYFTDIWPTNLLDDVNDVRTGFPFAVSSSFRIASMVPSPASVISLGLLVPLAARRRRASITGG